MSQGLSGSAAGAAAKELVLTRIFDAPRNLVFRWSRLPNCSARPALPCAWFFETAEAREQNVTTYHAVEGGKQTRERLAQHVQKTPQA